MPMMRKIARCGVLSLLVLGLLGCASFYRSYGQVVPDEGVTQSFAAYRLDPGMNYYFHGSDLHPNVIIGLKKQYVLANKLWQPIKADPRTFKGFVAGMQHKAGEISQSLYGFVMKSPDGQILGVWYSMLTVNMTVKMGEGNQVDVFTSHINVYDKDSPDQ